jgi:hypothetical protein
MIGNLNVLTSRALGISPYAHGDCTWVATLFDEYLPCPCAPIRRSPAAAT